MNRMIALTFATICLFVFTMAKVLAVDLLITHANVLTMDDAQPQAGSVAVAGGRIVAVGSDEELASLAGRAKQVIDVQGRTLLPGFYDSHMHPSSVYPFESPHHSLQLQPENVPDMEALITLLRKKAKLTAPGYRIKGSRYSDVALGRHPTRHDLDQASTEHPIILTHSSGHVCTANSLALELAGIDKDTPGGAFDRDPNGEPTGVCHESATYA